MKLITIILSLYTVTLTLLPCNDVPHFNLAGSDISVPVSDGHHKDIDHCSPFCTCDCSVTHIIPVSHTIHLGCTDYTFNEYRAYTASYVSSLYSLIWLPPKI